MTTQRLGYAFTVLLPPEEDERLRRWARETRGATWDRGGGHVTLARLTGTLPPQQVVPALHAACEGLRAFDVSLTRPVRGPYWEKPGIEIVMLQGWTLEEVSGVLAVRERLLAQMLPLGLSLAEGGPYSPHLTLTTGLPEGEAVKLEAAAMRLDVRFTARELAFWAGGEAPDDRTRADPPWHAVERLLLL